MTLRLVVFDIDGTLIDSQAHILASMRSAFDSVGHPAPDRDRILGGIGLSLPELMATLAPDLPAPVRDQLVTTYKSESLARHSANGRPHADAAFYPGLRPLLDKLHSQDWTLLAAATGKSKRGLDRMIAHHGLERYFQSRQTADFHPSKPHPSMLHAAMADTGVEPSHAVMIGDTSYDMDMARAAGLTAIGVSWGYHGRDRLGAADCVVDDAGALGQVLHDWMETLP